MRKWLLAGVAGVLVLAAGGYGLFHWLHAPKPAVQASDDTDSLATLDANQPPTDITTIDTAQGADPNAGATPMKDRVAVIGLLNKRNGASRDLTLKPGEATRVGDVIVRLRACEETAPWEQDHYTGAFVQVDIEQTDKKWKRVFSGWLYKERPGLNAVQHPVYDVWTKSCKMSFPDSGPDSVTLAEPGQGSSRSSAKKSPDAATPDAAPTPTAPASASPSNPT
jgi:hypothetical protein